MLPIDETDNTAHAAMVDVIGTLLQHGINIVHLGGLMRLMGVDDAISKRYDSTRLILDITQGQPHLEISVADTEVPNGVSIH